MTNVNPCKNNFAQKMLQVKEDILIDVVSGNFE